MLDEDAFFRQFGSTMAHVTVRKATRRNHALWLGPLIVFLGAISGRNHNA